MSFPGPDHETTTRWPTWVRVVALLLVIALVGFFGLSMLF